MPNPYVIAGIVAAVVLSLWKVYGMGYSAGANEVTAAYAASLSDAQNKERKDVIEVIKWKEKKVVEYRDRVTTIKVATDPTGCLDTSLSAAGLGGMLRAGSDTPRPDAYNAGGHSPVD